MTLPEFATRRQSFRKLHHSGCFVMPNPWDAGSARYLRGLGFPALATTSAGFAFSRGLPDGQAKLDGVLAHFREIVAAVDVPVNADFEAGYARDLAGLARNVRACVETGVAGLSIEDASGDVAHPLFDLPEAVERMHAARAAIDETKSGVLLTGRAECFLVGHADPFAECVRRLTAYAEAGADVLYAPGIDEPGSIKALLAALPPKPVNILMSRDSGMTVSQLAELGVRRISVGSSLARAAWTGFIHAAKAIARSGSFSGFAGLTPYREVNAFFKQNPEK